MTEWMELSAPNVTYLIAKLAQLKAMGWAQGKNNKEGRSNMNGTTLEEVESWAASQLWLAVYWAKQDNLVYRITYATPSGNIVNFMFDRTQKVCDIFEGRRTS